MVLVAVVLTKYGSTAPSLELALTALSVEQATCVTQVDAPNTYKT